MRQLAASIASRAGRAVLRCAGRAVLRSAGLTLLGLAVAGSARILTRLLLTDHMWGTILEDDYDSNYIDVHIKNLRKKLSQHSATDWLETVRGVGYRLTA